MAKSIAAEAESEEVAEIEGLAEITWKDRQKKVHVAIADERLRKLDLVDALPFRMGVRYPRQRNYQGHYYFAQVQHHVWHESLLEMRTLRWMDVHEQVDAIASQPFQILFADGSVHVPDFFAELWGHRQVVIDVKPTGLIDERAQEQFRKTRAVCKHIGWDYEIRSELTPQVNVNLEFVASFKHIAFRPPEEVTRHVLAALTEPVTIREAAELFGFRTLAEGRSALYHLVCSRLLHLDLDQKLSDKTLIGRANYVLV
jgi:hypothetical protein